MNSSTSSRIAIWGITLFVMVSSIGLWGSVYSNSSSPYDRTSRGPLLLLIVVLCTLAARHRLRPLTSAWAVICLVLALMSWLADVNALGHISLIVLLAGLLPSSVLTAVWAIATVMMTPMCSQIFKNYMVIDAVTPIRWAVAIACTVVIYIIAFRKDDRYGRS